MSFKQGFTPELTRNRNTLKNLRNLLIFGFKTIVLMRMIFPQNTHISP